MDFFAQLIRELIMEFPGAFTRWIYFRRKKPFKEILTDNHAYYNVILSFVVIGVVIFSIVLIYN